jgi:hypothetical protein
MTKSRKLQVALLLFVWVLVLTSTVSEAENTNSTFINNTAELQRTTSCVYGGLPMDVQFDVPSSPPRIDGNTSLGEGEVNQLKKALDPRISLLLQNAFMEAVNNQPKGKTALNFAKVSSAFEARLQNMSGQQLNLNFCGDQTTVGNAIVAAIAGWFSRAVNHTSSASPLTKWFQQIDGKAPTHEVEFVMLATANQPANSKVSFAALLDSFKASLVSSGQ